MSTIIDAEDIITGLNFPQRLQLLTKFVDSSPSTSRKFDDFLKKLAEDNPMLLLKFDETTRREKGRVRRKKKRHLCCMS